jgi:glycosyltransferase involved in cell wall biosynthesis
VDPDAVLKVMEDADIFVLTSRMESMPNVLLEAFSRSLPVVCTDVGGVGELVRDGVNGWLCPSEDVEGLARRIHELVEHPDQRVAMGIINRRLATSHFRNSRKGTLLLRAYSGERITDTIAWDDMTGPAGPPEPNR